MSAHDDAVASLVNGGYSERIAREILAGVVAEDRAETERRWAAKIREVGTAKGWSVWAAAFLDPDVPFVDTGMPSTETIVAELRRLDRAAILREAAAAINALPQGYECDPGRGDAADLLRRMADEAERGKDTSGDDQSHAGESTPDFFQPGHTYSSRGAWTFKPTSVVSAPDGQRVALGFIHGDLTYGAGVWTPHGEYELDGWRDITDAPSHATGPDGASQ